MQGIIFGESKKCSCFFFAMLILLCKSATSSLAPEIARLEPILEEKQVNFLPEMADDPELRIVQIKEILPPKEKILSVSESALLVSTSPSFVREKNNNHRCCIGKFKEIPPGSIIVDGLHKVGKGKMSTRKVSEEVNVKHHPQTSKRMLTKLNVVVKRGVTFDLGSGLHKTYGRAHAEDIGFENSTLAAKNTTNLRSPETLEIGLDNATSADRVPFKPRLGKAEIKSSRLQFLDVPAGSPMRSKELRLDDEILLFEIFSTLVNYLFPSEYPLGLVKNAVRERVPYHVLVFQIFKLEGVVLSWVILWLIVALTLPFAVLAYMCCPTRNALRRLRDGSINSYSTDFQESCSGKLAIGYLHTLLTMILFCVLSMIVSNETISRSLGRSTKISEVVLDDVENFVKNTGMQINFVATASIEKTMDTIEKDLNEIEILLGKPYQEDLFDHTEIDQVLNSLVDIQASSGAISSRITELLAECAVARNAGQALREKLGELSVQLEQARKRCIQKDKAVCDTLVQSTGFTITFSVEDLMADIKLKYLEHLGKEKHFNRSVEEAVRTAQDIPKRVAVETSAQRAELRKVLDVRKKEIYESVRSLEELTKSLQTSIHSTSEYASNLFQNVASGDLWRYLAVLGLSTMVFLAWMCMLSGSPCCCAASPKTTGVLLFGLGLSCIVTLFLWFYGSVSLIIGGHGHSLICQGLYDQPDYSTLGDLFDDDGILYGDAGFFGSYLKTNESVRIEKVLKGCELNQTAYSTFSLYEKFDVNSITNYEAWTDYKRVTKSFEINAKNMFFFSPFLQIQVKELSSASNLNLTKYRTLFSRPITNKDLNSLAEHLDVVGMQLTYEPTKILMRNLAYQSRKLAENDLSSLSDLRNKILYKITALELVLKPLHAKSDDTQSQMDAIQFIIDHEGYQIANKHTKEFLQRIDMYLHDFQRHVSYMVSRQISKCGPLWDVFQTSRFAFCKLLVDPINAFSLTCFILILVFLFIAPVVIKFVEYFRELEEELFTSGSHRHATDGLIIDDEGAWTTPSTQSPPESLERSMEEGGWISPRQPSEPLIPTPPRPPSELLGRISSSSRVPQISTITALGRAARPKSPALRRGRYETLKLIESIRGRTPSG